jgi:hypothetical protein
VRTVALRGFTIIGGVSTIIWVVTLFTAKHHRPAWELLSLGLFCFLVSAGVELHKLRQLLAREQRRDDLLAVIDRLTRECQQWQRRPFPASYREWLDSGEEEIAQFSRPLATEWAQRDISEDVGQSFVAIPYRLEKLHDIRRAVMTPGSHLGRGAGDPVPASRGG